MTVMTAHAETVSQYDAEKAIAYAKKHVNDSSQDCVQFLRECLEAGGVPKDKNRKDAYGKEYGYTEDKYIEYLIYNGYATITPLTVEQMNWYPTGTDWYVSMKENKENLSVGDGVLYHCTKCGDYFHTSFVGGVNEEGYALYYAQKRAVENKPLCKVVCSTCKAEKKYVELYGIHLKTKENGYDIHYDSAKVTGLVVQTTKNGKITLAWDALSDADGYYVFKKNSKSNECWSYEYLGTTKNASLTISELPEFNGIYNFVVRPYQKKSEKIYVGAQSERVLYQCKPVITISEDEKTNGVIISWTKVPGATSYKISKSKTGKENTWRTVCEKTTNLFCVDQDGNQESWYYRVVATKTGVSYSMVSDPVQHKVLEAPKITSVKNIASTGKVRIAWSKVSGAKKYAIYKSTSGKAGTYAKLYTTTKTSYTHSTIKPGQKCYYVVRAIDTTNNQTSKESAAKSAIGKCAAPSLTVKYSAGKPKFSWKKVSGAVEYHIYRSKTGKTGSFQKIAVTKSTSYTYKKAKKGTKYYYAVYAVIPGKSSAKSASSKIVTATSKK